MKRFLCLRNLLILSFLLSLVLVGCDLTLGPKVKTVYTIVNPGKPLEVLESVTIVGRIVEGTGDPVKQDIGGWVCMPMKHFEALKKALEDAKKAEDATKAAK